MKFPINDQELLNVYYGNIKIYFPILMKLIISSIGNI